MISQLRLFPLVVLGTSIALLGGAFAFQYLGDLYPCVLCIWQRWAHAAVIVLALAAVILADRRSGIWFVALAGVAMLAGAAIAGFHVGVEQQWWEGTAECGGTATFGQGAEALKKSILGQAQAPRCDEIPWAMFGISMAGWNMIISAIIGFAALWYAARCAKAAERQATA